MFILDGGVMIAQVGSSPATKKANKTSPGKVIEPFFEEKSGTAPQSLNKDLINATGKGLIGIGGMILAANIGSKVFLPTAATGVSMGLGGAILLGGCAALFCVAGGLLIYSAIKTLKANRRGYDVVQNQDNQLPSEKSNNKITHNTINAVA